MTLLPSLPFSRFRLRLLLPVALLFASGCAHQAALQSPPPAAEVVVAQTAPQTEAERAVEADAVADAGAITAAEAVEQAAATVDAPTDAASADAVGDTAGIEPAELDFATLYGTEPPEPYDPIADATLPPPAVMPQSYDPWETFNRRMHRFNNAVDRRVAQPLARVYTRTVPRPVRLGVGNFFNNLGQPVSALNALLQGKPKQAGQSVGRFLLNSTVGVGGLFDPATKAKLPNRSEDFGQTLAIWGWKTSRYVELPLFGPRTLRDVFGMVGDSPLSPLRQIEEDRVRVFLQGLQLVDLRAQLLSTDSFREGAADDYALVRDAWMQRRNYQISGDRKGAEDQTLPDYLQDEEGDPTIPVDAMPMPDAP
jgi:phospholipid-binding lipoprotein MlaA